MTKKQREALKVLEERQAAPIHRKVAIVLYNSGLIDITGFVKGKGAHWMCSLRQMTIFHNVPEKKGYFRGSLQAPENTPSFLQQNVSIGEAGG